MVFRLSRFLVLPALLLVFPTVAAGTQNLPDLGDESATVMSPHEERKLGEKLMRRVRHSLRLLDDPEISDYVQSLGARVVAHSDAAASDFEFFVIDDSSVNAFALLGGFIGIHSGLILTAQSESEVAAVLAHETAHISQRHVQRMLAEGKRTSRQLLAAVLAAMVLAGAGETQGTEATLALATAGFMQKQINFTRANEEEADRVGIQILAAAGFNPQAVPSFFERLQSWGRLNETALPEFLRTHPITSRRIAESRNRAEKFPYQQVPDSVEFHRIRAKLRATTGSNPTGVAELFRNNLAHGKYRNLEAERYGYALALLRVKDYAEARKEVSALLRKKPNVISYLILQAEIEMAAGQYAGALKLYAQAAKTFTHDRVLAHYYAAALLKTNHPQEAARLLKKTIRGQANDPALQKMLATAAGESGELLEAHQAMAEYYYLSGNPGAAIQQLKIARRFAGDSFYLRSSVDAKIKEIERELAADKKK